MIKDFFTREEIADILCVDTDMVDDLIADKGEWQTNDIVLLMGGLAKKLTTT
ncbi:MAG: hypothetical protein FWE90_11910 [Defluviitaleaceae bacterium]|nr:hypothetical protein [Defluviitaleaceae bacterium]